MSAPKITPEVVQGLFQYLGGIYQSKYVTKSNSSFMKVCSTFVNMFSDITKEEFMKDYATTVGNTIYIPFEIGVPSPNWPLQKQLIICVHENQHIEERNRIGWLYNLRYAFSTSYRSKYESEAYLTKLELGHYFNFDVNIENIVDLIKGYGCSSKDLDQVREYFNIRKEDIHYGKVYTEATKHAIDYLDFANFFQDSQVNIT